MFPQIYYQGFSVGSTTAEAVNYADVDQNFDDYVNCNDATCPPTYIRREMMWFRKDNEQQLEVSQASEDKAASDHDDESELSEISEHKLVRQCAKRRIGESQMAKKLPKQTLPRRSRSVKRPSDSHDLRGASEKRPRQSAIDTTLIPFKDLGQVSESMIQPQDLYKRLNQRLSDIDTTTL